MGVTTSVSSILASPLAPPKPRRLLSLLVSLLVAVGAVVPLPAAAVGAAPTVEVATSGLDRLIADVPSRVTVNVRVTDRGSLRGDAPLRLLGTMHDAEGEAIDGASVALVTGETSTPLAYDGAFVAPHEDDAALTLDANPALTSGTGATFAFDVTVPEGDLTFAIDLVTSNERSAEVVRREGPDRAGTAAAVSRANFNPGVAVVFISRSNEFADALAVGPAAGLSASPILLSGFGELPEATRTELTRLTPGRIVVLGGPAAIDDAVLTALDAYTEGTVTRIAGEDRYATAAAVATTLFTAPVDVVYVATGTNFADALAGGPAAARHGAPILLVRPDAVPDATAAALTTLKPRRIVVLGGPAAVSDEVVGRLAAYASEGVARVAGRSRYGTSAAIAADFPAPTAVVYLATGRGFPDAMAGAPAAILDGAPILLIDGDTIPVSVQDQLARLQPAVVVILGGPQAVPTSVDGTVRTSTRSVAPDRDAFEPLTTSPPVTATPGQPLGFLTPNADAPLTLRPGDRFVASVVTPRAGEFSVAYRTVGATTWQSFLNLTATGSSAGGVVAVPLNAPLGVGTYDLQLTSVSGDVVETTVLEGAMTVAFTFPPPLISSLVENVDGQTQLVSLRPAGGLQYVGAVLEIDLSSAERGSADYPLGGAVTLLGGNGTAELVVSRDARAMIRYVAGEGDPLDEADPASNPMLRFQIDGIDVGAGDAAHVGRFYRYDIEHGVQRVFLTGAGAPVASPTVSNLQSGNPHGPHFVSFALRTPLPAGESVTIDLTEAALQGVNYEEAFVFVDGGGHGLSPEVEHGPPPVGDATIRVVPGGSTIVTFTAGPDGVPSVQPEGPTINLFIGAVSVDDVEAQPPVTFTRSDDPAVATTTFTIAPMGLPSLEVTNLERGGTDLTQTFTISLDGALADGQNVNIDLSGAARGGADYSASEVQVLSGTGEAALATYDDYEPQTYLTYISAGDPTGDIVLTVSGVATVDADRSEIVTAYRSDSYASATTHFDIGAGSALAGVYASDLVTDLLDQWQFASFIPVEDVAPGTVITVDLSAAQQGDVDYSEAAAVLYDESGATVDLTTAADSAVLTYTVGPEGLTASTWVYVELNGVNAGPSVASFDVPFNVGDDLAGIATFSTLDQPRLTDVSVTDLAAGAYGQTQTIEFRVVGALVADGGDGGAGGFDGWSPGVQIDLSGAEQGGARYAGADVQVLGGSGTVELFSYSGEYASVTYAPGPDGDADGTLITIELRGVNTDAVDETHRADLFRTDSYRGSQAMFDIGVGGAFVGPAYAGDVAAGYEATNQWLSFSLAQDLPAGETVTIDLSAAELGGVSYGQATATSMSGRGTWALEVEDAASAVATFTAGAAGVPAGRSIVLSIGGIDTTGAEVYTLFEVTLRVTASDATLQAQFQAYPDYCC